MDGNDRNTTMATPAQIVAIAVIGSTMLTLVLLNLVMFIIYKKLRKEPHSRPKVNRHENVRLCNVKSTGGYNTVSLCRPASFSQSTIRDDGGGSVSFDINSSGERSRSTDRSLNYIDNADVSHEMNTSENCVSAPKTSEAQLSKKSNPGRNVSVDSTRLQTVQIHNKGLFKNVNTTGFIDVHRYQNINVQTGSRLLTTPHDSKVNRSQVPHDCKRNRSEVSHDPKVNRSEVLHDYKRNRSEVSHDPKVNRSEVLHDPKVNRSEVLHDPKVNRSEVLHDPKVNRSEVLHDYKKNRSEVSHDPNVNRSQVSNEHKVSNINSNQKIHQSPVAVFHPQRNRLDTATSPQGLKRKHRHTKVKHYVDMTDFDNDTDTDIHGMDDASDNDISFSPDDISSSHHGHNRLLIQRDVVEFQNHAFEFSENKTALEEMTDTEL